MKEMRAKEILALSDEELEKMRDHKNIMPLDAYSIYLNGLEEICENTNRSLDEVIEYFVNANKIEDKEHIIFYIKAYQHLKGRE